MELSEAEKELIFTKLGRYRKTAAGTWIYPDGTEWSTLPMDHDYWQVREEIIVKLGLATNELIDMALLKLAQEEL